MNNIALFESIYKNAKKSRLNEFTTKEDRFGVFNTDHITVCDENDLTGVYLIYRDGALVRGTGPLSAKSANEKVAELKKEYPYSKFRAVRRAA